MAAETRTLMISLMSSAKSRKDLLTEMGFDFTITTLMKKQIRMQKPEDLVMALAEAKMMPMASYITRIQTTDCSEKNAEPALLITADTAVAILSRLQNDVNKEEDAESTLLIAADQVHLIFILLIITGSLAVVVNYVSCAQCT
ncbi:uncharacterized protein LOC113316840 [Papaver somniferum]|uniref:uncharacterized protein LOC113316840 n=1 Tax=Papaver somniferum TaxID=3469 RepID=UPI000E700B9D|nr:uncharacterized protein LOC113316840 [Papaver somniferum]